MSSLLQRFYDLPVGRKLGVLVVLIAIGVIGLSVVAARMQYTDLYQTREDTLRREVDMAQTIVAHYAELARSGRISWAIRRPTRATPSPSAKKCARNSPPCAWLNDLAGFMIWRMKSPKDCRKACWIDKRRMLARPLFFICEVLLWLY